MRNEATELKHQDLSLFCEGFYAYLTETKIDDFSITLASWREGVKAVNDLCPLTSDLLSRSSSYQVLKKWHQVVTGISDSSNVLEERINKKMAFTIDKFSHFHRYVSQSSSLESEGVVNTHSLYIKRSDLHSYLTHYPLFSTLLLIVFNREELKASLVHQQVLSMLEQTDVQWWLLLLARLKEYGAELHYPLCLAFDKARQNLPSIWKKVPLSVLKEASLNELFHLCQANPELVDLAGYFQAKPKTIRNKNRPIYQAINQHQRNMMIDGYDVNIHTPTDIDGEYSEQSISIAEDATSTAINKEELTTKQARLKFHVETAGMANACRRANKRLPMDNLVLTVDEFSTWLNYNAPELMRGELKNLDKDQRRHWFLFFLKVLGIKDFAWVLINKKAKESSSKMPKQIVYERKQRQGNCWLLLPCDLFKGKQPSMGSKQYYSSQTVLKGTLELPLPWPMQSLFQLILQDLPAQKRHKISLLEAFQITEEDHKKWLRELLSQSRHVFPFKVTGSRLFQTFHRFCGDKTPHVLLDYLSEQGSVQMHYINAELEVMPNLIHRSWYKFLEALGRKELLEWNSESAFTTINRETYHDQFGSAITLRKEVHQSVSERLLQLINNTTEKLQRAFYGYANQTIQQSSAIATCLSQYSEISALYVHIRCATELGLRPVKSPYPCMKDCAHEIGLWTVQDKRSHHEDEWRLLVLSEPLKALVMAYWRFQSAFQLMSTSSQDRQEQPIVTVFDGEHWCSLDPKQVARLFKLYLSDLEPGTFRHVSARIVFEGANTKHDSDFSQAELNVLMNHFERGQSPLSSYQLSSIPQLAERQRRVLEREFSTLFNARTDKKVIESLERITEEGRYVIS